MKRLTDEEADVMRLLVSPLKSAPSTPGDFVRIAVLVYSLERRGLASRIGNLVFGATPLGRLALVCYDASRAIIGA